jgi:hypothetical protein
MDDCLAAEHRIKRRNDEQAKGDQCRDRVARQREHERAVLADSVRRGTPGFIATPANTSRTPGRCSAERTWSCGPTDTPPVVMSMSTSRIPASHGDRRREVVARRASA